MPALCGQRRRRCDAIACAMLWWFPVEKLREYRLRHLYGTRYDFRRNVLDWDYQVWPWLAQHDATTRLRR